jgi:hypothetical protein
MSPPSGREASSAASSPQHPHEPGIAPVLDAEGRCLICLISHADKLVSDVHDLMYDIPLPEQATETHRSKASNAIWAIHEVLRSAL